MSDHTDRIETIARELFVALPSDPGLRSS